MKILDDIIATLDVNASVKDIRQGVFHTGVLSRNCGMAASLPQDALRQKPPMVKEPGMLTDKSPAELCQMAYSTHLLEAAIGMATINSLLKINDDSCIELNAADLILEKGVQKNIAIIGHFPFVPRIKAVAKNLWVFEKNPKAEDYGEAEAEHLLPEADIVAITGTTLTNHTIEHVLKLCNSKAYVIILGDSAPLSPVLFDYGIDVVSGTQVIDSSLALRCISEGANFRQIKGIKKLTMMK